LPEEVKNMPEGIKNFVVVVVAVVAGIVVYELISSSLPS
jgi:hypothetical protein